MTTSLPAAEVERRINAATTASTWSFGIRGRARFGRLRLWVPGSSWGMGARAVAAGRIEGELVGTRLRLRLRPPLADYYGYAVWYGGAIAALAGLGGDFVTALEGVEPTLASSLLILALILPLHFVPKGNFAQEDRAAIVAFLERYAGARPQG